MSSNTNEPEPPKRQVSFSISMPTTDGIPAEILSAFGKTFAEAQLLEQALKHAISNDVSTFVPTDEQASYLDILAKATLGHAKGISTGETTRKNHRDIAGKVGFFALVRFQWAGPEEELDELLSRALDQRNRLAHTFLADVVSGSCNQSEAFALLDSSAGDFFQLRTLIVMADAMSAKFGDIAPDGSSLSRVKRQPEKPADDGTQS